MSERIIVFSPRARERLEGIGDYLYEQHLSAEFVVGYLQDIEDWLGRLLGEFPESGTPIPEYGAGVRAWCTRKTAFSIACKAIASKS